MAYLNEAGTGCFHGFCKRPNRIFGRGFRERGPSASASFKVPLRFAQLLSHFRSVFGSVPMTLFQEFQCAFQMDLFAPSRPR